MRSVRISLKTARACVSVLRDSGQYALAEELLRAMEPKRSVKAAKVRKTAKKRTKKEETAEIREALLARAGGVCECGCGEQLEGSSFHWRAEMDHFFPKARTRQTVKTCWLVAAHCHRMKTANDPDAAYWLEKFASHCETYGYTSEANRARALVQSQVLIEQASQLSRGEAVEP